MTQENLKIRIIPPGERKSASAPADDAASTSGHAPLAASRRRLTLHRHTRENPRPADCNVILTQSLYRKIVSHLSADVTRERGGLLLGYVEHLPNSLRPTVVVAEALPARHTEASVTRLTFTLETWAEFERQTDVLREQGFNYRRVGWYHSHPGHGIFLSTYDLNVCADFPSPTQVALVVDPVGNDGGFFVCGESGYRGDAPQGFWEWHDCSHTSIVEWQSLRISGANWEVPLPAELLREASEKESSVTTATSIAAEQKPHVAETIERIERLPSDTLFPAAATSRLDDDPAAYAIGEQTAMEVPRWLAALALGVPTLALIALAVFSYRTNEALSALAWEAQEQKKEMQGQKEETQRHLARLDALQALIESLRPASPSPAKAPPPEEQSQTKPTAQTIPRNSSVGGSKPPKPPSGGKTTPPAPAAANATSNTSGASNAQGNDKANNEAPGNATPAGSGNAGEGKPAADKSKTESATPGKQATPTPTPRPETRETRPSQ